MSVDGYGDEYYCDDYNDCAGDDGGEEEIGEEYEAEEVEYVGDDEVEVDVEEEEEPYYDYETTEDQDQDGVLADDDYKEAEEEQGYEAEEEQEQYRDEAPADDYYEEAEEEQEIEGPYYDYEVAEGEQEDEAPLDEYYEEPEEEQEQEEEEGSHYDHQTENSDGNDYRILPRAVAPPVATTPAAMVYQASRVRSTDDLMVDSGCITCYDRIADTVLLPCGHLILCMVCSIVMYRHFMLS